MAAEFVLRAPSVLATLPKPVDSEKGRTLAATVHSQCGSRLTKRPEIAIGIDGEGISIYSVKSSSIVTSYAVSSQLHFLCPPCSIYHRPGKAAATTARQRLTYAVVGDQFSGKVEVICFREECLPNAHGAAETAPIKTTFSLGKQPGRIVKLFALPIHGQAKSASSSLDILVVFEQGRLCCVSGDLQTKRWEVTAGDVLGHTRTKKTTIEFASVDVVHSALKGMLQGRESLLDSTLDSIRLAQSRLVTLISRDQASDTLKRRLHVLALPLRSQDPIKLRNNKPHEVFAYDLPPTSETGESKLTPSYSLRASTGRLTQLYNGKLMILDICGTSPRLESTIETATGYRAFLPLNPNLLLLQTSVSLEIRECVYGSTQTTQSWIGQDINDRTSTEEPTLELLNHFPTLGVVYALSGSNILEIQTRIPESRRSSKFQGLPLVDCVGKGTPAASDQEKSRRTEAWTNWMSKVDDLLERAHTNDLELLLGGELGIHTALHLEDDEEMTNNESDQTKPGSRRWEFPSDVSKVVSRTDPRKAAYLLSKVFSLVGEEASLDVPTPISISLPSINIFRWLAITGYLTPEQIQKAVSQDRASETRSVQPGDIVAAVYNFDQSLGLMYEILDWPMHFDPREIVRGLQITLGTLQPQSQQQKRLAARDTEPDGQVEQALELETAAADDDLDFALAALNDGIMLRSATLHAIFERLHSYPAQRVTELFRSMLSKSDVIFLIQLLRIELATGNWTSRQIDAAQDEMDDDPESRPSDRSIKIIGSLLNSAIDAVGTSGWLVGGRGPAGIAQDTDDMLDMMRIETSAALEGCYEAASLSTYLDDFERYSNLLLRSGAESRKRKRDDLDESDALLPLGYKVPTVSKTRTSKGGIERNKSKAAMGREISMRVGKYSIEHIRI